MGMYDNIIISLDLLPITEDERKLLSKYNNWQTKDLECGLITYEITPSGKLRIEKGYTKNPDKTYENFTGAILFYEYTMSDGALNEFKEDKWFEFKAVFENGIMQMIIRLSPLISELELYAIEIKIKEKKRNDPH